MEEICRVKAYEPLLGGWTVVRFLGEDGLSRLYEIAREGERAALRVTALPDEGRLEELRDQLVDGEHVRRWYGRTVEELTGGYERMRALRDCVGCAGYRVVERTDRVGWDVLARLELLTPLAAYRRAHPLGRAEIVRLGVGMCRALEGYHGADGRAHRGVRVENIYVAEDGGFRLGPPAESCLVHSRDPEMCGSVLPPKWAYVYTYVPPEVYRGGACGPEGDVYALGMVLYRLLNGGRIPFLPPAPAPVSFSQRGAALKRRMDGVPLPPPADADPALAGVVKKACAFRPEERYPSPARMRRALERYL